MRQYLEIEKKGLQKVRSKYCSSCTHYWDKIQRKEGGTYDVNKPVEIENRISPRTIFIVLALLTRSCINTLHKRSQKEYLPLHES